VDGVPENGRYEWPSDRKRSGRREIELCLGARQITVVQSKCGKRLKQGRSYLAGPAGSITRDHAAQYETRHSSQEKIKSSGSGRGKKGFAGP